MSTKKSNKTRIYVSVIITVVGCVLACSSIIPNGLSQLYATEYDHGDCYQP